MGCCDGDTCVTTSTRAHCGNAGSACQPCGDCLRCSARGVCEVNPASSWGMTAVSAVLDATKPNGAPWDSAGVKFGGPAPDPFVQLEIPSGTPVGYTDTLVDTTTPAWNQPLALNGPTTFQARDLLAGGQGFRLWVGDEDNNLLSDVMCEITDPLDPDVFLAGGLSVMNLASCQSLVLQLTCQP
jgi:hypothetical protein